MRIWFQGFWTLLVAVVLGATARGEFIQMPPTMQETLQLGVTAFTNAEYDTAVQAFDHLAEKFGKEPQYQPLVPTLLPIWGYACQMSNRPSEAVEHYLAFLDLPNTVSSQRAFVLFSLAQAYQQNGEFEEAVDTYQQFIETAPDSPEAVLSAMRQAELYFEEGDDQAGIDRLVGFAASERVPPSLAAQAQLRALQKTLELEDYEQARTVLFDFDWQVEEMPELAVLTFSALQVGNWLLSKRKDSESIRAYRLVTPGKQLEAAQLNRLQGLQYAWDEKKRSAGEGYHAEAIWNDYYRSLMRRVESQLQSLKTSEDFTPGFQMRLGQAFLFDDRPREAFILFRVLAKDESLEDPVRASAHYRWILAANALEDWDESLRIARLFLERYPDHPEAPGAMFLIANAYQEKTDYREAMIVLTELLDAYPTHPLAPRWLFSRGFNATLAQEYLVARDDFTGYLRDNPEGPLVTQARLWDGMTYFFDRRYDEALQRFDAALADTPKRDTFYPELFYRRAQTLYSARDYTAALTATDAFLKDYADHLRGPEARVLRGDILMGEGELLKASNQFAKITPEAGPLFAYAVFQRGKIQQALEAYDLMISHFTEYVRREDIPEKTRVAEALYWIGWAHQQQGSPATAFPLFVEALGVHGNDPQAGETDAILQALDQLHGQYHAGEFNVTPSDDMEGLLTTMEFPTWLADQRDEAMEDEAWTWLSRINLYRAQLYAAQDDSDRANTALLEIVEKVPLESLDAQGLAKVGGLLADLDFNSAREYFDRLREEHPRSPQVGAAYYGLAKLAAADGELIQAEAWLNRFEAETPYHANSAEAKLLRGQLLVQLGRTEQAVAVLEELLRLKSARGRPHAQALLGIAQAYEQAGQSDKAIAYYQRVYTLYRAYPDEVLQAYLASAPLFESRGDLRAAYNTWRELQYNPQLTNFAEAQAQAAEAMARLEPILPPEEVETVTAELEDPSANEEGAPL